MVDVLPFFLLFVQGLTVAWRLPAFPVWFLCLLPQAKPGWVRVLEVEDVVVLVVEDEVAGIDVLLADVELEDLDDADVPVPVDAVLCAAVLTHIP